MSDNLMKQFKKGILELVILKLLSKREMYGYEIVAELNRQSTELNVKEGTLYPILYRLEDESLIETRWEQSQSSRAHASRHLSANGSRLILKIKSTRLWSAAKMTKRLWLAWVILTVLLPGY